MPVAEIFLSAFVEVLFDRLASRELLEFATRQGIRPRLKKLEENLKMINRVITRAEKLLFRETEVDEWLEELRDWAYDADDFLDEVNTRAMQRKQQMKEEEEEEAIRNNTSSSISASSRRSLAIVTKLRGFLVNRRDVVVFGFNSTVDELNSRLDTLSKRMHEMRMLMKMALATDNTASTTPMALISRRPLEAPAEEFDARVFGREQEKERIIEQLKSSSSRDANVEVIPIVGMTGIGKTTLARHVFDSVQQLQHPPLFDITGWVCVSDDFDVNRITSDIIESFTSRASNLSGLNQLQSELKEVVGGKRFLLVLDDVWTRNYSTDWATLRSPFRVAAPGSKILVTTRDDKVASMVQTDDPMKIHHPGPLCNDDCWSVFLQHVIDERHSVFESEAGCFRMKILDKCKGLPLTAKLLAGLLRGESPAQRWEAILNNSIWDVSENELSGKGARMLPVVMLSYFHLPPKLKRCFSYCSVLPKDYEFREEEVVLLWMAEGLVLPERGEQPEDTGAKYFGELVSRSLFQPSPKNRSRFLMHDLISDMAEMVAGKSCFKFDGGFQIDINPAQARYSSYHHFSGLKKEFETFERTKYLRSFQSFDHSQVLTSYVPLELLMKLKYLRVLCLSRYSIRELPEDIGDLMHLRLVDLSYTYVTRLPESTSNLYNLLALKLIGCVRLQRLPAQIRKLVNLRILDCSGPNKLVAMPLEMGKLTSLQKLSNFIVGKGSEQGLGQLKYLSHLKGCISISFLENVRDSKEAREVKLMSKEGLQSLELKWNSDHGDLRGTRASFHVCEELQPHKHVEKLIINGYSGLLFPGWIGDDRFAKMRVIELVNCEKCNSLPPLGKLPVLEEVRIRNMPGIVCVGEEFYGKERGAFPSLKILKVEDMENWCIWSYPAGGGCRFGCLQELHLINCPKLSGCLPDGISLQKLTVRKCDELLVALPRPSILDMVIGECKVVLMERLLKEDGDASQLLPSVTSSLLIEKVDVVEAVGSAMMRMNIISSNKDVVEANQKMTMLGSLRALEMASIPKLTHLPGAVLRGLPKLEKLRICRCEELTSLWKMDDGEVEIGGLISQQRQKSGFLNSLRVLDVRECCQLVCLVPQRGEEEEEEEDDTDRDTDMMISGKKEEGKRGKQPQYLGLLPCGLETLALRKCDKLEKLPSDLHNLTSLSELEISDCVKLEKLPSDLRDLTALRTLYMDDCRRLSGLPETGLPSALESLYIKGCELLTCLYGNGMPLPRSLKSLSIWNCPNLKSLPDPGGITRGRRLKVLSIAGCENLGRLSISVHRLTALEHLRICGWPAGLRSIQLGGPDSLPPNLRTLHIEGVGGLFSVPLPPSLTSLRIYNFRMLSPEAFQSLTSLQDLHILDCPELTSIPDQLMPPSLLSLYISGCPLLAPQFAKGRGRYWPKVKFIPRVAVSNLEEVE